MTDEPYFTTLPDRGILKISGTDRKSFLQGLITNDINLLDSQGSIYACLLTPQGKFLFDFFITEDNDTLILDCEGGERLQELEKILKMYALRGDLKIQSKDNIPVYAIFGHWNSEILKFRDSRHPDMGTRSFIKPNLAEKPFESWDTRRIALCIPDGSRDMLPGKSTMAECNMDNLNAIDYNKGCYVGQELTARMHYRGLVKKHLRVIELLESQNLRISEEGNTEILKFRNSEILSAEGKTIGEMRSSCGNVGLALLKKTRANSV